MTVTVRLADPPDAADIARIHVRGWQSAYRGLVPDSYLDSLSIEQRQRTWANSLAAPEPEARIWIAVDGAAVIGFCSTSATRDADGSAETGEVQAIYVEPALVGTGVGRELFTHAVEDLASRYNGATLWVLAGNDRAIRFNEITGWRRDGTTKTDAREWIDAA